jgi:hypothetical protein
MISNLLLVLGVTPNAGPQKTQGTIPNDGSARSSGSGFSLQALAARPTTGCVVTGKMRLAVQGRCSAF